MTSQNFNLIQWNLNWFYKKYNELQLIIQKHNPKILCLQETNFNDNSIGNVPAYTGYHKNRTNALRSSGGVAIYISNTLYSTQINLLTNLEAIAITIHGKEIITVCNIYLSKQTHFNDNDLAQIISQLPSPYIITGDFNSHNEIWGSLTTDKRGKSIEKRQSNPLKHRSQHTTKYSQRKLLSNQFVLLQLSISPMNFLDSWHQNIQ